MQSERTAALISRLKAHLEKTQTSQVALSQKLGISAAALSEVMRGRNAPNAEVALHIAEILDKPMSTTLFEPKPDRPPAVHNHAHPRTLAEARERISELEAQLARLENGDPEVLRTFGTAIERLSERDAMIADLRSQLKSEATTKAVSPAPAPAAAVQPALRMIGAKAPPSPPPTAFPETCGDSPEKIHEYVSGLSTPELLGHLKGTVKNDAERLQQQIVTAELRIRKSSVVSAKPSNL